MSTPTVPNEEKTRAIVRAATSLFQRYGYRRTSVDLIAQEAKLAKATVYAYFDGKEAIFLAVCEEVCALVLREAEAALARPTLEEQLFGALSAKFTFYFELVQSSPHAAELVSSQDSIAEEIIARTDRAYQRLLSKLLGAAVERGELDLSRAGLSLSAAVEVLIRCAYGVSYDAKNTAAHKRHLSEVIKALLRGLGA
jgi:AcrR family transcriptional regulator